MKNIRVFIILIMIIILSSAGIVASQLNRDQIQYSGQTYVPLQLPQDPYTYFYDKEFEVYDEDTRVLLEEGNFQLLYANEDLYVLKEEAKEAKKYYSQDENYQWYLVEDTAYGEEIKPLSLKGIDLDYITDVEDHDRDMTLFFEDYEKLGSLKKISKDKAISGILSLGYYQDKWYWRSEIIDESQEEDGTWPEYVQEMPESVK